MHTSQFGRTQMAAPRRAKGAEAPDKPAPRKKRSRDEQALAYMAWDLQDRVVDDEQTWLASLPVAPDIRIDIYKHLCRATGRLIGALIDGEPV